VPVTAFLRFDDARRLAKGSLGYLELYSKTSARSSRSTEKGSLELEKSSSFAAMLEGAPIWVSASRDSGSATIARRLGRPDLYAASLPARAYPAGTRARTFSSPATWAQLVNELENDPKISKHYQPWLFIYNSGNPVPYSAGVW
jgi:hypothetical protein